MPAKILLVDSDAQVLEDLSAALGQHYPLVTAASGKAALQAMAGGDPVAVLVCNLELPDMDGAALLARVGELSPQTVRMAVSPRAEYKLALKAVNQGKAVKVLGRPLTPQSVAAALAEGLTLYQAYVREKELFRDTLQGTVKVLVDILGLVSPHAIGRSKRIKDRAMLLGRMLGAKPAWQLDLAVTLSHVGCVALPKQIVAKLENGEDFTPEERRQFDLHPRIAARLLHNIARMANVAQIILNQNRKASENPPLESRILKAVLDLDHLERKGAPSAKALAAMRQRQGAYDPKVLDALAAYLKQCSEEAGREVPLDQLEEGMVLAQDLLGNDGVKLLLKGQAVSKASLMRLKMFAEELGVAGPVLVAPGRKDACAAPAAPEED